MAAETSYPDIAEGSVKIAVVVPVHKAELTTEEFISLSQCCKVLKGYDIFLLYPEKINIHRYQQNFPNVILRALSDDWMSSLEAYNEMKCSLDFYSLFEQYDFLLTYEPDAYIFSDNWSTANVFNYDFIGAPWFRNYGRSKELYGGGNSGFSMRNVSACIKVIKQKEKYKKHWDYISKLVSNKVIAGVLFSLVVMVKRPWKLFSNNYYYRRFFSSEPISEDIFWTDVVPHIFSFKVAPVADALKFSFEINPAILYEMNNKTLPIGCHAWKKYDPEFWKLFIA